MYRFQWSWVLKSFPVNVPISEVYCVSVNVYTLYVQCDVIMMTCICMM